MKRYTLILLCLLPMLVSAAIYKSVDKDGNVIFSDQPQGHSTERVDLPPVTSYGEEQQNNNSANAQTDANAKKSSDSEKKSVNYTSLALADPANNATIWYGGDNTLTVTARSQPSLQSGDQASLLYDGQSVASVDGPSDSLSFTLSNYTPGKHTLAVSISRAGQTIKTSDAITIYVLVHHNK